MENFLKNPKHTKNRHLLWTMQVQHLYVLDFNNGSVIYTDVYILSQIYCEFLTTQSLCSLYTEGMYFICIWWYQRLFRWHVLFMSDNSCFQLVFIRICTKHVVTLNDCYKKYFSSWTAWISSKHHSWLVLLSMLQQEEYWGNSIHRKKNNILGF